MKIGIYFESSPREGGAFHENINLMKIFNEYNKDYNFVYIVSSVEIKRILENHGCKTIFFRKNILFRVHQFLFKFIFFKYLFKKLKIENVFEKFVLKNKIDLTLFNSPSEISLMASNLPFVIILFEFQHRTDNYLPEYVSFHDFNLRELIIDHASKRAFKILVATEKDKNTVVNLYNAINKNIEIQPYVPFLPDIYNKNKDETDYDQIFRDFNLNKKSFLFYPAQFWPHKNHRYLIDACEDLKKIDSNFKIVFSGYDKGNLIYLKNQIDKKNLQDKFIIFDYLSNDQVISLYLNAKGLVMPTFVGHSTLPLYEAFYFKLPVFFTEGLLDDNLRNLVHEIDILKPEDLSKKINRSSTETKETDIKTNSAYEYYLENCSRKKLFENFSKIFEQYKYLKRRWSEL
tara:strand:+ start:1047 stop:2252 length:1206 start_codon:yes stop_codon:yes gene_type:complete